MNKTSIKQYFIGDLIKIQSGCMGVVYDKYCVTMDDILYRVHFCGEVHHDPRWLTGDDIRDEVREF